jgi:hypothetical protein
MMKLKGIAATIVTIASMLALTPAVTLAAFDSGSTGADGDLTPTTSTVRQIPESGVFNFGVVNIPTGVTVTFTKNSGNTPVTILATGDVTISGTISVNGSNASNITPGAGGPGGFDGGVGGFINSAGFRGQGPGGGIATSGAGGGGGFGYVGNTGSGSGTWSCGSGNSPGSGGSIYGNTSLTPLIGGSGGGGGGGTSNYVGGAGGGGGGALLIASSGTIRVIGAITSNGGSGAVYSQTTTSCSSTYQTYAGGGGSGGGIRLIANTITGEGTISAAGGGSSANYSDSFIGGNGGSGWIRLEGWQITRASNTTPPYTSLSYPTALYPANIPSLAITQINGINAPVVTFGSFRSPDVTLPLNTTGPVSVTVTAQNVPAGKTVTVKALPESGNNVITATATLDATSTIQVNLALSSGTAYVLSASVNY